MMEEEIQENHLCADLCLFIDDENYEMKSCSFLKEIKHSFSLFILSGALEARKPSTWNLFKIRLK